MIVINTLPFYTMYVYTMVIELNFWYLVRMIQVRLDDLKNNLFQLMQTVQSEKKSPVTTKLASAETTNSLNFLNNWASDRQC